MQMHRRAKLVGNLTEGHRVAALKRVRAYAMMIAPRAAAPAGSPTARGIWAVVVLGLVERLHRRAPACAPFGFGFAEGSLRAPLHSCRRSSVHAGFAPIETYAT